VTTPANRTWWIVLNVNAIRELTGVLFTDEGQRVHVLNGTVEEDLVRDLAAHADPTVDVAVTHGWEQAPPELVVKAGPGSRRHR